MTCFEEVLL